MFILSFFLQCLQSSKYSMNKDKGYSFRSNVKTQSRQGSRNCLRLETLPCCQVNPKGLASPPLPKNNQSHQLYQGDNSYSSYLRRVKIGSYRLRNGTNYWPQRRQNGEHLKPEAPSYFQQVSKELKPSNEAKSRSTKSFMIRSKIWKYSEKNSSNYSKKQQDEQNLCDLQGLDKLVIRENFEHSTELERNGFGLESKFNQSEQIANQTKNKPKSVYTIQNSQGSDWNLLKVKAVICRQPKRSSRGFKQMGQSKNQIACPSIEKKEFACLGNTGEMLRKMKIVSHSSVEESKDSKLQTQKTNESQENKQEKLKCANIKEGKENKHKSNRSYGCKTIRVPWETRAAQFHEIQNNQHKKPKDLPSKMNSTLSRQEWAFGQISMIPFQSQRQSIAKKEHVPIESLQELCKQLEIGGNQSQLCATEEFSSL